MFSAKGSYTWLQMQLSGIVYYNNQHDNNFIQMANETVNNIASAFPSVINQTFVEP